MKERTIAEEIENFKETLINIVIENMKFQKNARKSMITRKKEIAALTIDNTRVTNRKEMKMFFSNSTVTYSKT